MLTIRFLVSWMLAAVLMYLSFYAWHGVFLNEIQTLQYSHNLFYVFAAITYLVISFLLLKIYETKIIKGFIKNIFLRGLCASIIMGLVVFVMTQVTGVGFSNSITLKYLMLDSSGQNLEQCIGGLVIVLCQLFIYDPILEEEAIRIQAK